VFKHTNYILIIQRRSNLRNMHLKGLAAQLFPARDDPLAGEHCTELRTPAPINVFIKKLLKAVSARIGTHLAPRHMLQLTCNMVYYHL
jgi:hypothetical protein